MVTYSPVRHLQRRQTMDLQAWFRSPSKPNTFTRACAVIARGMELTFDVMIIAAAVGAYLLCAWHAGSLAIDDVYRAAVDLVRQWWPVWREMLSVRSSP